MPDDGDQESCFILCSQLESFSDGRLRIGDRRVGHESRRVKRWSASAPFGIGHRCVQLRGYVRQKREFLKPRASGADDEKVAPTHAESIRVTLSIRQDPGPSPRPIVEAHGQSWPPKESPRAVQLVRPYGGLVWTCADNLLEIERADGANAARQPGVQVAAIRIQPGPADHESSILADAHSWRYLCERGIDHCCQTRHDRAFAMLTLSCHAGPPSSSTGLSSSWSPRSSTVGFLVRSPHRQQRATVVHLSQRSRRPSAKRSDLGQCLR